MGTAGSADAEYSELKGQQGGEDYESLFIIIEDGNYNPPSSGYCNQLKVQYGLTMPVLIDDGTVMSALGISSKNHWNIVVGEGAEVVYKKKYDGAGSKAAIEALLEP